MLSPRFLVVTELPPEELLFGSQSDYVVKHAMAGLYDAGGVPYTTVTVRNPLDRLKHTVDPTIVSLADSTRAYDADSG